MSALGVALVLVVFFLLTERPLRPRRVLVRGLGDKVERFRALRVDAKRRR